MLPGAAGRGAALYEHSMELHIDSDAFDEHQMELLYHVAAEIRDALVAAGLHGEKLQKTTEDLTFGISAIFDGDRLLEFEGKLLRPVVTFAMDDAGSKLLAAEGGSWMHEYAVGAAEQVCEEGVGEDSV